MDQLRISGDGNGSTLEASKEEFAKIQELKLMLKEHISSCVSLNEQARQALVKYQADNDMLLKFVRGRKLNLQKALDSVIRFTNVKHKAYPDLFPDEVPGFVWHVIRNEILTVLKNRDSLGRTIIMLKTSNWDVNQVSLEEIICAGRYIVEALMNLPEFLQKGTILLTDCTGTSINHAKHFTIPTIVKFVNVFWQAYPIQIKGLYFVNAPLFVRPVYALVKPFLPKKLRERVLITPGVSELYKRIETDILPDYLGGVLSEGQAFSRFQVPEYGVPLE